MASPDWAEELPASITVSDAAGTIVEMNARAAQAYARFGGKKLVGTNMLDCHPEPARTKLKQLMESRRANVYTTERNGAKRLVFQAPWLKEGQYAGYVEIVIDLPQDMPHFVRK